MAMREKSARNAAVASYLRGVKGSRLARITNQQISERTGIPYDTIVRLFNNHSDFTVDQFLLIAETLGVSDTDALAALSQIVAQ